MNTLTHELTHEGVIISLAVITPANARLILDTKNGENRAVSKSKVLEYTRAMSNNEWCFNGDSIRFKDDGSLADGQHRLIAITKSLRPQTFVIIKNMPSETSLTIDIGKKRDSGDVLALEAGVGKHLSASIGGAIKLFDQHNKERSLTRGGLGMTNTQVVDEYRKHKDLIIFCSKWVADNIAVKGCLMSRSEVIGLMMIFSSVDMGKAIEFMRMVFKGVNIFGECTEQTLRDYLIHQKTTAKKSPPAIRLLTVIKAWNSIRSGRQITKRANLQFNPARDAVRKAV